MISFAFARFTRSDGFNGFKGFNVGTVKVCFAIVLRDGRQAGELPYEVLRGRDYVLNTRTAQAVGTKMLRKPDRFGTVAEAGVFS